MLSMLIVSSSAPQSMFIAIYVIPIILYVFICVMIYRNIKRTYGTSEGRVALAVAIGLFALAWGIFVWFAHTSLQIAATYGTIASAVALVALSLWVISRRSRK